MSQLQFGDLKPQIVLGIAAHPDDLDFGAAGTLAKFATAGAEVHYLILTDGSKGSDQPDMTPAQLVKLRQKEQQQAVKIIGGKGVDFLNYTDGELEITMKLKSDIVKVIRRVQPDVVVTMDPTMVYSPARGFINHPDHRAAGQATLDAVFPLARDHLAFPDLFKAGLLPHKTATVLLINFDQNNYAVDVSNTFDTKIAALKAYASQVVDIDLVGNRMREHAEAIGRQAGYQLAESFMRIDIAG